MRGHAIGAVAGFSTALPTLAATLDVPTRAVGNDVLLHRLDPYENSNRIPVTLVDALNRPRSPYGTSAHLQQLLDAVAYCMQPVQMAHLRSRAAEFVAQAPESERRRYFDPAILTSAGLPGGAPVPLGRALLDLAAGPRRSRDLRDTYRAGVRRFGRAWRAFGA
ncbi:hypothetical protein ON062_09510 [Microbacterium sp. C7(2022)]|nr:hypothetical protein [Microbacterium sp. C7(2022)]MDE0546891.1 hypothetical protein [Microbacterium sp. C7(2022)]